MIVNVGCLKKNCTSVWCSSDYDGPFEKYSILRPNVVVQGLKAPLVPINSSMTAAKKADVKSILDFLHCNENVTTFYDNALK